MVLPKASRKAAVKVEAKMTVRTEGRGTPHRISSSMVVAPKFSFAEAINLKSPQLSVPSQGPDTSALLKQHKSHRKFWRPSILLLVDDVDPLLDFCANLKKVRVM